VKYYNVTDDELCLTKEGKEALNVLGITIKQLKDYPDEMLNPSYWQGCKTYVDQALKNGKGVTWLDDCRIPAGENLDGSAYQKKDGKTGAGKAYEGGWEHIQEEFNQPQGRFPANLLVSDDCLNDGKVRTSGTGFKGSQRNPTCFSGFKDDSPNPSIGGDSGSYSRYFDLDKWWAKTFPFLIVPKASKSEKNKGLEGCDDKYSPTMGGGIGIKDARDVRKKNFHPTVKPLKLMSYLISLGSREKDLILDPYVGSGTTCLAARLLGRKYVGIDNNKEYLEIARKRIEAKKAIQRILF